MRGLISGSGLIIIVACTAVGGDESTVQPLNGWSATRVSEPADSLGYQLLGGIYLEDGRYLFASRSAIGPTADHNIIVRNLDGSEEVLVAPEQYPAPDRLLIEMKQDPLDPDRVFVLDGGSWTPTGVDGRLFELDLTTGMLSTLVSDSLVNPASFDVDVATGDLFIADRGDNGILGDGQLWRWDRSSLTEVIAGIDANEVHVLDPNVVILSEEVSGPETLRRTAFFARDGRFLAPLLNTSVVGLEGRDSSLFGISNGALLKIALAGDLRVERVEVAALNATQAFGSAIAIKDDATLTVFERRLAPDGFLNAFAITDLVEPSPCATDIDGDGETGLADLSILLSAFGSICTP